VTPPTLTMKKPAADALLQKRTVVVKWSGSDSGSGLARFEVMQKDGLSGSAVLVQSNLSSSLTLNGAPAGTARMALECATSGGAAGYAAKSSRRTSTTLEGESATRSGRRLAVTVTASATVGSETRTSAGAPARAWPISAASLPRTRTRSSGAAADP